jgi:hypothetical protein
VGGVAVTVALVGAPAAPAATLLGDYQLQGTTASSGPGPSLSFLNLNTNFQSENVMGSSRQVLAFGSGSGAQMAPVGFTGGNPPQHSVVMTFRLLDDTGYNRILDWSHGTDDNGIYDRDRKVRYYRPFPEATESPGPVFGSNTYSTLAVTVSGSATRAFVNGAPAFTSSFREMVIGDALTFFVDNTSGGNPGEESAGAVSCIRVYSGVLSDTEIAAIGASPDCITHPAAPQPPVTQSPGTVTKKKCKKHKKKHRSAESAKKKCKKKRKKR